jgi:hypothetical protein
LGQFVIVASDLRNNGCDIWVKSELIVVDEKSTDTPKIERWKKVLNI